MGSSNNIIINGSRDTYHWDIKLFTKNHGSSKRSITPNNYKSIHIGFLHLFVSLLSSFLGLKFFGSRRLQHGTAFINDTPYASGVHRLKIAFNETFVSTINSNTFYLMIGTCSN